MRRIHPLDGSENKIDGAMALIMAIGRHMVSEDKPNIDDFLANAVVKDRL